MEDHNSKPQKMLNKPVHKEPRKEDNEEGDDKDDGDDNEVGDDIDEGGDGQHTIGGLSCKAFGGPDDEIATKEMVYWSDIPSDAKYVSPFKKNNEARGGGTQYMTFEPDGGGWNNIRMAMETVVVMAHAMGRTLVLPPAQGIYLLRKDRGEFFSSFHLLWFSNCL